MRSEINQTLDLIDELLMNQATSMAPYLQLHDYIERVQDAYIEIIQQALRHLMLNQLDECHQLLQSQRDDLQSTFERIGLLIEEVGLMDREPGAVKVVIEYLFTRARLVDELKMFPSFGVELLERLTLDESIEATVDYMEGVMTGKKNLYRLAVNALTAHDTFKKEP